MINYKKYITEKKSWQDAAKWVNKHKQFVFVDPKTNEFWDEKPKNKKGLIKLDAFTANLMVQIMDVLGNDTGKEYKEMDIAKAVDISWKLTKLKKVK